MIGHEWNDDFCDKFESGYYGLIDVLTEGIQHLEAKAACLRYTLNGFLPKHDGEMLRCSIFHDLMLASGIARRISGMCQYAVTAVIPREDDSYAVRLTLLSIGGEAARP